MKSEESNFESFEKIPYDEKWVKAENEKRNWMSKNSLYREDTEHASCGVGLVVSLDGKPNRKVVENGIEALKAIWHRGAVDADGKTGDGAGIHIQIPVPFFYDQIRRTGHEPRLDELIAIGQLSHPIKNDKELSIGIQVRFDA